jgi:hypothetical protein
MATILEIKDQNNDYIRAAAAPGSITKTIDANMRDVVANELRDRGVLQANATGNLPAISKDNSRLVLVSNVGMFIAFETVDDPDGDITFASADAGWLWKKVLSTVASTDRDKFNIDADYEYTLEDGFMLYEIWLKPSAPQPGVKVGIEAGGDEIMLEDDLVADEWKVISKRVFAEGADQGIFISGIDADTVVVIYKRSI